MTKILYPPGCAQIPSPKNAPVSGEILVDTAYGPVVVQGLNASAIRSGDPIEVTHGKGTTIEVDSASGTTIAKAANVFLVNSTKLAAGTGDVYLGRAALAKTAGQLVVRVVFGDAPAG